MSLFIMGCAAGFFISSLMRLYFTVEETKEAAVFTSDKSRSTYRRRRKQDARVQIVFADEKRNNADVHI